MLCWVYQWLYIKLRYFPQNLVSFTINIVFWAQITGTIWDPSVTTPTEISSHQLVCPFAVQLAFTDLFCYIGPLNLTQLHGGKCVASELPFAGYVSAEPFWTKNLFRCDTCDVFCRASSSPSTPDHHSRCVFHRNIWDKSRYRTGDFRNHLPHSPYCTTVKLQHFWWTASDPTDNQRQYQLLINSQPFIVLNQPFIVFMTQLLVQRLPNFGAPRPTSTVYVAELLRSVDRPNHDEIVQDETNHHG